MSLDKARRRERKYKKSRYGMRITNRSIFVLEEVKRKRAEKIRTEERKKKRKEKE